MYQTVTPGYFSQQYERKDDYRTGSNSSLDIPEHLKLGSSYNQRQLYQPYMQGVFPMPEKDSGVNHFNIRVPGRITYK